MDIIRAFGISQISIKRTVKLYREEDPKGFYAKRKTRGAAVLTPQVLEQAQQLFDEWLETPEVADRLAIKATPSPRPYAPGVCINPLKKSVTTLH